MIRYGIISLFLLLSCAGAKEKNTTFNEVGEGSGGMVIRGQIVSVYKPDTTADTVSACSKHPCKAKVLILEVIRKGQNWHSSIAVGNELIVNFVLTLSPTEDLFPELTTHLPGLKEGDKFQAGIIQGTAEDNIMNYAIDMYKLVK